MSGSSGNIELQPTTTKSSTILLFYIIILFHLFLEFIQNFLFNPFVNKILAFLFEILETIFFLLYFEKKKYKKDCLYLKILKKNYININVLENFLSFLNFHLNLAHCGFRNKYNNDLQNIVCKLFSCLYT